MGSVLFGAVINIVLDPIFIFTLNMGVSGSSLATVISQFCSCVCIIWFFFTEKSLFHFRVEDMRLKIERIIDIVSLGFTPFVMTITECAIQIVFNINLNRATGGSKGKGIMQRPRPPALRTTGCSPLQITEISGYTHCLI